MPRFFPKESQKESSVDVKRHDSSHLSKSTEVSLASFCSTPEVYLQTLRVILYNGSKTKVVCASIDQGSMRTYVSEKVAKELNYEPNGKVEIVHSLFGGVNSKAQHHNIFSVKMRDLNDNFACNFEATDQKVICGEIPSIKRSMWVNELEGKNIFLSDLESDKNTEISLLIGSDIAGKLMTGEKFDLRNGLTAFNTLVGWFVMGKISTDVRVDSKTRSYAMLVANKKIADLWRLDTLGIMDPIEKRDRKLQEQEVKEICLKTAVLNENSRYTVDLPWKDDHAPIGDNRALAKQRLDRVVEKLNRTGRYNDYHQVFEEWLKNDIIEIVPEAEINDFGHYLPHRPILKEASTTKVRPVFDASAHEKGFPA